VVAIEKYKVLRQHFATPPNLAALLQLVPRPAKPAYRDRLLVSAGAKRCSLQMAEIAYFSWKKNQLPRHVTRHEAAA